MRQFGWRAVFALAMCVTGTMLSGAVQGPAPIAPTPEALTLRVIVVASDGEAERVLEQLRQGADFAALASSVSQDPSRGRGGLLGRTTLSTLRQELRDALRGLTLGQVTRAVRIPTGYAVLKVVEDGEVDLTSRPPTGSPSVAAVGAVKYVFDVSGFNDAAVVLQRYDKPADWNLDPVAICRMRTASLLDAHANLRANLESPELIAAAPPAELAQAHFTRAQLFAYEGRMAEAVEDLTAALRIANAQVPVMRLHMEEALGIAHLHKAMHHRDVHHAPGSRCLLTLTPGQSFGQSDDVERAITHFMAYLREQPEDLEVRWLLNMAHVAAGTYPDGVPRAHRIDPSAFASAEDVGRFVDVAPQRGARVVAAAGGVIVDDFDNDGRLDLLTSSMDSCAPLRFFHRSEDGMFVDRSSPAGLDDQLGGLQIMQTDYDNDGCLDVLVLRGGWEPPQRKSLLRNNCKGTFTDVTAARGLAAPATSTQAAAWADIDNDGWLDLFVGNEGGQAQLFRNRGDGTFEDIAARAGVARPAFSKGVAAGDFDNDGWIDLYISNRGSVTNFLYRNNRDGTFTEMAEPAGVPGPGSGFVTWFFDYDNDGWLDIFATSYFTSLDETARTYLGLPHNAATLKLYRNQHDGTFADVTREVALDKVFMPMGSNFGDVDNDGFLDIYLGTGSPSYGAIVPSVLLRNREGKAFVDVTASSGTGELHKGHGVAFADLDHDGDQEIVFQVGGATPGDAHALRIFDNPGHDKAWLGVKLVGVKTNRAAIGARLTVTVQASDGTTRTMHRVVSGGGSFGASPLQQHVGLGQDVRRVDIEVWWPTSGTRQRFSDVGASHVIEVVEFSGRLERPQGSQGRAAAQESIGHQVKGMVVSVNSAEQTVLVSHDAIADVMGPMVMPFAVQDPRTLEGLTPGVTVTFTLVMTDGVARAEGIAVVPYESAELDPMVAQRLRLLQALTGSPPPDPLPAGTVVPDFTLTDQTGADVSLSQLRGQVVVVNFVYTSCALTQFCFRVTNHFATIGRRFGDRMGKELTLLTVTFDPARDTVAVLREYASQWDADPRAWRFLTGDTAAVKRVCDLFGVDFFPDEGLMNHTLRTAVIDRTGTLVARIEGNQYSAAQLGDLVADVLRR